MPEGPEVEIVKRGLTACVGTKITKIMISKNKKYWVQKKNIEKLIGSKITKIERKGKFLLWFFKKKNTVYSAINHLGMTGVWHLYSEDIWQEFGNWERKFKHYKLNFELENGLHLLFIDPRTFGKFQIISPDQIYDYPAITDLGPDILDTNFNIKEFKIRIKGKKISRKIEVGKALLIPSIVAGCGNIYKSEALFRTGLNPFTPVNLLSDQQIRKLAKKLVEVGLEAVESGGSTLQDYRHVDGYSGLMQNKLLVYGREGKPCTNCQGEILAEKQGDRTSFYCPTCQER